MGHNSNALKGIDHKLVR